MHPCIRCSPNRASTEKVDGMFATIVIVLPSRFTGGTVCVSHGDLNSTFEHCANSLTQTTVLAWYTDVEHQVKAVTSGYRLALSPHLIHTTNALRPAVASHTAVSRRLRHILLSWKQAEQDAPAKIVYVLSTSTHVLISAGVHSKVLMPTLWLCWKMPAGLLGSVWAWRT